MRLAVPGLVALLTAACGAQHPTDAELISNFRDNRAQFEILRTLALKDYHYGIESIDANDLPEALPKDHKTLYDHAFNEFKIQSVRSFRTKDTGEETVDFVVSTVGLGVSGSLKEYVWTTSSPKPIVISTDRPYPKDGFYSESGFDGYRTIGENWYLHVSSN